MLTFAPCSFQLVELAKAQDVEAGDGTTTVVIIAGSLLSACHKLLEKGTPNFYDAFRHFLVESAHAIDIVIVSTLSINPRTYLFTSA